MGQYDWDGLTMDIYDDPLPLEVEDLAQVDARWSKEARLQESPLLAYGGLPAGPAVYRGDPGI